MTRSSAILVKKLARNDCFWADSAGHHQNGLYIPLEVQRERFFPDLTNENSKKPHIFDTRFATYWPASGEVKLSALKHYTNKRTEFHFTRVPHAAFSELTPASWIVGGKLREPVGDAWYWFVVVDSASNTAEQLESTLDLAVDFRFAVFSPSVLHGAMVDDEAVLISELEAALKDGTLDHFVSQLAVMPGPGEFAQRAQHEWLQRYHQPDLDPWRLESPGDAVMQISRDVEYRLYRQAELRFRAAQVLRVLSEGAGGLATKVVRGFRNLDAVFLSATQARKSRAGASFELHVAQLLRDGRVHYQAQAILSTRRPDFVLPGVSVLRSSKRNYIDALIVSLKTTLRERWKQLSLEKFNCDVILATVDDRVSTAALADMQDNGIRLMVPESLKNAKESCYKESSNVMTFRQFFDDEIARRRPSLRMG